MEFVMRFLLHCHRLKVFSSFVAILLSGQIQAEDTWRQPFKPDENTVVLYHFDEGTGNQTHDAMGDKALTLNAYNESLWGQRDGFGTTAKFDRQNDHLLVGPTNNDKLQLRTCTDEWTIEAWVRYTGPGGKDHANSTAPGNGYTFANICGSDEEGAALADGYRHGWLFYLRTEDSYGNATRETGLLPGARFIGSHKGKDPNNDVGGAFWPGYKHGWIGKDWGRIYDTGWHHVAWQFRYRDQTGYMFVDGQMTRKVPLPAPGRAPTRIIENNATECDIPFQVGGFLRPTHLPGWKPGDFGMTMYNMEGEIDELRISNIMRYPVAENLTIIREKLPAAGIHIPYQVQLNADAAGEGVTWKMMYPTSLPKGLILDRSGLLHGIPEELVEGRTMTIIAADNTGNSDKHTFELTIADGEVVTESVPSAFVGSKYRNQLKAEHLMPPLTWDLSAGRLPRGISLNRDEGVLSGTPKKAATHQCTFAVTDANGTNVERDLTFRVLPTELLKLKADAHTVVLYDWKGPSGRLIPELITGDESATLTYTNMGADRRYHWTGREGRFPQETGHGEHGYVSLGYGNPVMDMKTCDKEWTVEAWIRRGGPYQAFADIPLKKFDYGHICGTYDKSERGVWELYLSESDSPNGSMAPGVHFQSSDYTWKNLHPWKRPEGITAKQSDVGINDIEWHHVAWQYSFEEDLHQLFLDGKLIWQITNPDGRNLVNDRSHNSQFSVFSRIGGAVKYGGDFNYLGFGNFFGQIGEIRISSVRRYGK